MHARFSALLMATALSFATTHALAQSREATLPEWDRLTAQQREALVAPVRERWDGNPEERSKMLERAQRWSRMTPDERRRADRGKKRWHKMSPEEQQQMRAFYDRSRDLTPGQRKALREELKAMTPAQRRAWMERTEPPSTP